MNESIWDEGIESLMVLIKQYELFRKAECEHSFTVIDGVTTWYQVNSLSRYLTRTECLECMYKRVASVVPGEASESLYYAMTTNKMLFSTPVMCNAGKEDTQSCSACVNFSIYEYSDVYGICEEIYELQNYGAGIGINISPCQFSSVSDVAAILHVLYSTIKIGKNRMRNVNRSAAISVYMHVESEYLIPFVNAKHPLTVPEHACLGLNYAVMVSDQFMFCLSTGIKKYVASNNREINVDEIWETITKVQSMTGEPFIVNIDRMQRESIFKDKIELSNLCTEIVQPSTKDYYSVCTLGVLNMNEIKCEFDIGYYSHLMYYTLQYIISNQIAYYSTLTPTRCTRKLIAGLRMRNVGMGVCGLGTLQVEDNFAKYGSLDHLNQVAKFMKILHRSVEASSGIIVKGYEMTGHLLEHKRGIKACDLMCEKLNIPFSDDAVAKIAFMPTVTTSACMGVSENIEPMFDLVYVKNTSYGDYIVINREAIRMCGIVLNKENFILLLSKKYDKTICSKVSSAMNASYKDIINVAAICQPYVDQAISLNLYADEWSEHSLTMAIVYANSQKLKTLKYYNYDRPDNLTLYNERPSAEVCVMAEGCSSCKC